MSKVFEEKKKIFPRIMTILIIVFLLLSLRIVLGLFGVDSAEGLKVFVESINNNPYILLFIICLFILMAFFNPFSIILVIYIIVISVKKIQKLKNRMHPKFDIAYFRDDLSQISPAIVSLMVDLELDLDRDIPAHTLKLILDGYIEEDENGFIVTKKDRSKLLNSDNYLLEYVSANFQNPFILEKYKKAVYEDAIKLEYLKSKNKLETIEKILTGSVVIIISLVLITVIFSLIPFASDMKAIITSLALTFVFSLFQILMPIGIILIIVIALINRSHEGNVYRTKSGNILLEQIMGLKNFMKDFSNLDDSKKEELILREYYLIYAIVLNINTEIDDKIINKIKKQMQKKLLYK